MKLVKPWHGPYRVLSTTPTIAVAKMVYSPQDGNIQVHLDRVTRCPPQFPSGYYWYGSRCKGTGNLPKWLYKLTEQTQEMPGEPEQDTAVNSSNAPEQADHKDAEDDDTPPAIHKVPETKTWTRTGWCSHHVVIFKSSGRANVKQGMCNSV